MIIKQRAQNLSHTIRAINTLIFIHNPCRNALNNSDFIMHVIRIHKLRILQHSHFLLEQLIYSLHHSSNRVNKPCEYMSTHIQHIVCHDLLEYSCLLLWRNWSDIQNKTLIEISVTRDVKVWVSKFQVVSHDSVKFSKRTELSFFYVVISILRDPNS